MSTKLNDRDYNVANCALFALLPGPRCDNLVSKPLCHVVRVCRRERRAPKGWIVRSHIAQRSGSSMPYMYMPTYFSTRPFRSLLASGSVGTLKLSEFGQEYS
ncbi:hypothetical protein DVH24_001411 [Malus domestica]|uniref:Uncharacterized protein n=1 Tax=Malus domestica TaxID=3750 RepID=A0A498K1B5_MALDO|nr:hypothetical protein DVH24_001411 [Malus domestica]